MAAVTDEHPKTIPLAVIDGGRITSRRRAGRRRALDEHEQVFCPRCERERGVASSVVVKVTLAPRRTPAGKKAGGTDAWVCARCLGDGEIVEMIRG